MRVPQFMDGLCQGKSKSNMDDLGGTTILGNFPFSKILYLWVTAIEYCIYSWGCKDDLTYIHLISY